MTADTQRVIKAYEAAMANPTQQNVKELHYAWMEWTKNSLEIVKVYEEAITKAVKKL